MPPRMYESDFGVPSCPYNITQPFRPDRAEMVLERMPGRWKFVGQGDWGSVSFDQKVGIYTTGLGWCVGLLLLVGRMHRYRGRYAAASLAHLMGGADAIQYLDIPAFIGGAACTPQEVAAYSAANSWYVHLVVAGSPGSLINENITRLLTEFRKVANIHDQAVTVYRGSVSPGFGASRDGWIGLPRFGNPGGQSYDDRDLM